MDVLQLTVYSVHQLWVHVIYVRTFKIHNVNADEIVQGLLRLAANFCTSLKRIQVVAQ